MRECLLHRIIANGNRIAALSFTNNRIDKTGEIFDTGKFRTTPVSPGGNSVAIRFFGACPDSTRRASPHRRLTVRILVMNGPNLGALGERQPEIYGLQGMDSLPALVRAVCGDSADGAELVFYQSNHEGELIDRLEAARREGVDGIVLNAGALTHTSLALADCLAWIGIPCVEVHISNVFARTDQPLRRQSLIGGQVIGVIAGFGLTSYALAVAALLQHKA